MSIHRHKTARMRARLEKMLHDIEPLTEMHIHGDWEGFTNQDKKDLIGTGKRISALNHRIRAMDIRS